MEIWHAPVLALVGILAGWMNVMAGGGSLLTIPVMVFMGIPGPVANGTNRIAIIAQTTTTRTMGRSATGRCVSFAWCKSSSEDLFSGNIRQKLGCLSSIVSFLHFV